MYLSTLSHSSLSYKCIFLSLLFNILYFSRYFTSLRDKFKNTQFYLLRIINTELNYTVISSPKASIICALVCSRDSFFSFYKLPTTKLSSTFQWQLVVRYFNPPFSRIHWSTSIMDAFTYSLNNDKHNYKEKIVG